MGKIEAQRRPTCPRQHQELARGPKSSDPLGRTAPQYLVLEAQDPPTDSQFQGHWTLPVQGAREVGSGVLSVK